MGYERTSSGRVVQTFVIKLGGSHSKEKKPAKTRGEPTVRDATPPAEPDAEIIFSKHVESDSAKTTGRHTG